MDAVQKRTKKSCNRSSPLWVTVTFYHGMYFGESKEFLYQLLPDLELLQFDSLLERSIIFHGLIAVEVPRSKLVPKVHFFHRILNILPQYPSIGKSGSLQHVSKQRLIAINQSV